MMNNLKVLLVILMVQVLSAMINERAPYTLIKKTQEYEERAYNSSNWICHSGIFNEPGFNNNLFWPLFGYMAGLNSEGASMDMAKPLTVKVEEVKLGEWRNEMCFYLPGMYQLTPPVPDMSDVHLQNRTQMNVFAKHIIGGRFNSSDWIGLANGLRTSLESAEPAADFSSYYLVSYDSPSKTENRTNEVWFRKKLGS